MPETPETAEIGEIAKNIKNAEKAKMLKIPKIPKVKIRIPRFYICRLYFLESFHFGIEICNISKLCKWWRRGGGGAQAVPRASALFLFQLFQIKMNQNRLNKFENSYFL